ncbi:MAG: hypothetical protein HY590_04165 [Candidatus Omnitrophica bacterium]|nr:hypothetical protein [Candidatus Omnitrophota bacterium]
MGIPYVVITADYELFFGSETGTTKNCLIVPTEMLRETLRRFGAKMTLFVDILYYKKLCDEGRRYPHLLEEAGAIKRQIQSLAKEGHEVALHVHPHWLDARYEGNHWVLPLHRYRLHQLSQVKDLSLWETIAGCFTLSRELLESIVRETEADYRIVSFRAGGFCLQPFRDVRETMKSNHLLIDSSVFPGGKCHTHELAFDFRNCPGRPFWRFEEEVTEERGNGTFLEIPITAIPVTSWRRVCHALLRRQGGPWVRYGNGETMAIRDASFRTPRWKLFAKPFSTSATYLNYESMTFKEMLYLFNRYLSRYGGDERVPIVFLGHPKAISKRSLCELRRFLKEITSSQKGVLTTLRGFYGEIAEDPLSSISPYAGVTMR